MSEQLVESTSSLNNIILFVAGHIVCIVASLIVKFDIIVPNKHDEASFVLLLCSIGLIGASGYCDIPSWNGAVFFLCMLFYFWNYCERYYNISRMLAAKLAYIRVRHDSPETKAE